MIDVRRMSHARLLALPLAFAVAASTGAATLSVAPQAARADSLDTLQQRIEDSAATYDEAAQRVEELQQKIEANEQRISEIEAELPQKKRAASEAVRTLYKMNQGAGGIIELLLSSDDFNDVITNARYLDAVTSRNNDAVNELLSLTEELDQTRSALASEKAQAESDADAAKSAMDDAVSARQAVQEARAQQAAEEAAAAQAAIEAAQKAAEEAAAQQSATFTTSSGNESEVKVPENTDSSSDSVVWSEKDTFVNNWAPRIDAYLEGSPLAGYGKTFAEAAWTYGVDPRFSPAISCVESSKGAVCFKSHNAWGWGSSSWDSWESAIYDHVAGLAAGYGGQLSVSAAQKYCPPTWENWYASVLSEMNSI